ncbi:hypothetical protein LSTR_LSTR012077 [Laodelphax striatellus]|uniref:ZP domain-containing protein n=2 Tax=Laodelphax striatellus TaxID=195883 RepID=A0A482WQ95_LAOST|nr:hypothetical protein LSTR_LSTR012077 [Laodelphax striatellus]
MKSRRLRKDQEEEVYHLSGEPDYRFVTLRWQYPKHVPTLNGFQVRYCELQAWGPNRCRTKMIEASAGMQETIQSSPYYTYSIIINGLRMATNYTFEVQPMETRRVRYFMDNKVNHLSRRIIIPTKGFSAKASLCLPDVSEVEVATGPYFGGRIAVETGGDGEDCAVSGDGSSPREVYTLRIQHKLCGSYVNRTAVTTFILVQENLPILTHSTRRFLVLCTFQPETLTVRAGLNLPSTSLDGEVMPSSDSPPSMNEMIGNEVQASPLQLLQEDLSGRAFNEESEAQLVVVTVVVLAMMVAIGLTIWWFIPTASAGRSILSEESPSPSCASAPIFENYENSLRDSLGSVADFSEALYDENDREEADANEVYNSWRSGACNSAIQEACNIYTISNNIRNTTTISIDQQNSQSEA